MTPESQLLIEQQCRKLSLMFARLNDEKRYDELGALFTEDGVFRRPLQPDQPLHGRSAIVASYRAQARAQRAHHVCTNILVDVESAWKAAGLTYFTVYLQPSTELPDLPVDFTGKVYIGSYSDRFVLTETGWKIASRRGENRLILTQEHSDNVEIAS